MWRETICWLALAMPVLGQTIQDYTLDPHRAIELSVSSEITTLTWPGAISAVAGADVLIEDGAAKELELDEKARFHVVHSDGSNFILVRSLKRDTAATLSVIFENAAYVVLLKSAETGAVASAILHRPPNLAAEQVSRVPEPVKFTPRIGLSLLDRARMYPVLARTLPKLVEGVDAQHPEAMVSDWPDLAITVEEVYRFQREDALVFLVSLKNKTDQILELVSSSFAVRVGDEKFYPSIANGPRTLGPGQTAEAEFAVVGLPDGTRNDVSAKNLFTISIITNRPGVAAEAPNKTEEKKS